MRLTTPPAIQMLQRKLYVKAKTEPTYGFYRLYDKVYGPGILAHADAPAKANRGKPGVDGGDIRAGRVSRAVGLVGAVAGGTCARTSIDAPPFGGCTSQRPAAGSVLWGFRPYETAWRRLRRNSCCRRSSKPTTPTR